MKPNCVECDYRDKSNGNCTAVGGFCTAVPAAHCKLLKEYQATGLTPEQVEQVKAERDAAVYLGMNHDLCDACGNSRTYDDCHTSDYRCVECGVDCPCKSCENGSNWHLKEGYKYNDGT